MVENILRRAKRFIGLEEEAGESNNTMQLEIGSLLKAKKEPRPEGSFEIMICEPKIYEDSLSISTNLRAGSPAIVSLKHLDPSEGTRLIDFVCGTTYAIDGHMTKIGESIFLFTPGSVVITSGDERQMVEEEGLVERGKRDSFFSR